ncbi:hypothetical protein RM844_22935 [Streptomyces sp. DSM 44915]|uniref:SMI1/KNR4 family protein n=1 Tax=Streptomyces chisholmiae TaxID=3075540 RepID=A0ABU2JW02_9ACTN|nr:hypothetical protein [Streptomyces sp. DSM 44915]MDT0269147.1 hypothetical protein [Streptomyces sp. DSM 44915]
MGARGRRTLLVDSRGDSVTSSGLAQLVEAAGLGGGAAFDWAAAERRLRMRVPRDYRRLLDAGGHGLWFDHLVLFAPGDRYGARDLLDGDGVFADLQLFWADDPGYRPAGLADGDRLIAWAGTGIGATLYWLVSAEADGDGHPLYVESADGDQWERFDLTTTDFLAGVLRGTVRSELLSAHFLDVGRVFRPYADFGSEPA